MLEDHTYLVQQILGKISSSSCKLEEFATPERQYVWETLVMELSKTGTVKSKRPARLVLFNDLLLVLATNKGQKLSWDNKKQMRHCYSLFNLDLREGALPESYELYHSEETRKSHSYRLVFRFQFNCERDSQAGEMFLMKLREYLEQCEEIKALGYSSIPSIATTDSSNC